MHFLHTIADIVHTLGPNPSTSPKKPFGRIPKKVFHSLDRLYDITTHFNHLSPIHADSWYNHVMECYWAILYKLESYKRYEDASRLKTMASKLCLLDRDKVNPTILSVIKIIFLIAPEIQPKEPVTRIDLRFQFINIIFYIIYYGSRLRSNHYECMQGYVMNSAVKSFDLTHQDPFNLSFSQETFQGGFSLQSETAFGNALDPRMLKSYNEFISQFIS